VEQDGRGGERGGKKSKGYRRPRAIGALCRGEAGRGGGWKLEGGGGGGGEAKRGWRMEVGVGGREKDWGVSERRLWGGFKNYGRGGRKVEGKWVVITNKRN